MKSRILLISALAAFSLEAQTPLVQLTNETRPGSADVQVGDQYKILITGAAHQPVSVRTTMQGRTDWGPVIGRTDNGGRWTTTGQFEKDDFGSWSESWTVGGKLAHPVVSFQVGAPCLKGGMAMSSRSGPNLATSCDTALGSRTFVTPSMDQPFRTPDGRMIDGRRSVNTSEQYRAEIMQYLITSRPTNGGAAGQLGDEAAAMITKIIGVNALSEDEIRNVLAVIHAAFEKQERLPQQAKNPSETLLLLRKLEKWTGDEALKKQIVVTEEYVQSH